MKASICVLLACSMLSLSYSPATAAERRMIGEVPSAQLISETQIQLESGDGHLSMFWWIPQEFWESAFARDTATPESQKQNVLNSLKNYSILGVVQADISPVGAFDFYPKPTVLSTLKVAFKDEAGEAHTLTPLPKVEGDLQVLLNSITPILTAAMGNLGQNFQFLVFENTKDGKKIMDPYKAGAMTVKLQDKAGNPLQAVMKFPLDSLYKPRLCPNGEKAHITWKFCPWTGHALPE